MKSGWQTKKLGHLCEIELGKTPSRANKAFWDEKRETSNVWLSIADLLNGEDNLVIDSKEYLTDKGAAVSKIVRKGTLLASFKLTLGRLAFAGRDLFTNEAIAALNLFDEQELSKEFLFYFLHHFDWDKACEGDVKLKGKTLNKAKLKEMDVHFPILSEQQRIVGILDEAFEGLITAKANAAKNLQNGRAIFESHLQSVFTQRGEGWVEKRLGEVCSLITDGKHGDSKNEENSGYYFLSAKDVKQGTLNFDNARQITKADFEETHRRTNLKPNDICMVNTGATIGKLALAPNDPRTLKSTFQKSVAVIKAIPSFIDNAYCCYHLMADLSKLVNVSSGSAQKNLLLGDLKAHIISMPHLKEQSYIVAKLDALSAETQRLESIYRQKLAALDALKKSLLDQAFTGQL